MIKNKINSIERKLKAKSNKEHKIHVIHRDKEGLWEYNDKGEISKKYKSLDELKKDKDIDEARGRDTVIIVNFYGNDIKQEQL